MNFSMKSVLKRRRNYLILSLYLSHTLYIQKFLDIPFTPTQKHTPIRGTGENVKNLRNLTE